MSPWNKVAYLEGDLKTQYVGVNDPDRDEQTGRKPRYEGPRAEVTFDHDWLHIQTDPYEGHVMINIEALPNLIKALNRIKRHLKVQP